MVKTKEVTIGEVVFVVTYDHTYDPGVYTYPNGDPGYPPVDEIEIQTITMKDDPTDLSYVFDELGVINKFEELL